MLRLVWRRKRMRRVFKKILKLHYNIFSFNFSGFNHKFICEIFINTHLQALPQRQHYFNFGNLKNSKSLNFSAGYVLKLLDYKSKFFKRSYTSSAAMVLFFRYYYLQFFKYIYIYRFKNFNYRQIYYFKKLNNSIKLEIYYLLHKKSYIPRFFPPRRIKRRVLRLLGNQ